MSIWDRLHEFVPGKDEVRKYEEDGSDSEKAAALEHSREKHRADQYRVNACSDFQYAGRYFRDDPCEDDGQQGYDAE